MEVEPVRLEERKSAREREKEGERQSQGDAVAREQGNDESRSVHSLWVKKTDRQTD